MLGQFHTSPGHKLHHNQQPYPQVVGVQQRAAQHAQSHKNKLQAVCRGSRHHQQASVQQQPERDQQQQAPLLQQQLTSLCAAAAITLSSCLAPAGLLPPVLLTPAAAEARPRMTAEEMVSVDVFKKSTPSVVNVTNLTARYATGQALLPYGSSSCGTAGSECVSDMACA